MDELGPDTGTSTHAVKGRIRRDHHLQLQAETRVTDVFEFECEVESAEEGCSTRVGSVESEGNGRLGQDVVGALRRAVGRGAEHWIAWKMGGRFSAGHTPQWLSVFILSSVCSDWVCWRIHLSPFLFLSFLGSF